RRAAENASVAGESARSITSTPRSRRRCAIVPPDFRETTKLGNSAGSSVARSLASAVSAPPTSRPVMTWAMRTEPGAVSFPGGRVSATLLTFRGECHGSPEEGDEAEAIAARVPRGRVVEARQLARRARQLARRACQFARRACGQAHARGKGAAPGSVHSRARRGDRE